MAFSAWLVDFWAKCTPNASTRTLSTSVCRFVASVASQQDRGDPQYSSSCGAYCRHFEEHSKKSRNSRRRIPRFAIEPPRFFSLSLFLLLVFRFGKWLEMEKSGRTRNALRRPSPYSTQNAIPSNKTQQVKKKNIDCTAACLDYEAFSVGQNREGRLATDGHSANR